MPKNLPIYFPAVNAEGVTMTITNEDIVQVSTGHDLGTAVIGIAPGMTEVCIHTDGEEFCRYRLEFGDE